MYFIIHQCCVSLTVGCYSHLLNQSCPPIVRLCCSVWCSVLTNAPCNAVLSVAGCSVFEVNHRRLVVHFAVHFLPMPCYCWLGGCRGVHFFLPCSYCSEKSAIRSPFALCACLWCWWWDCLSNGLTWRYGAIKRASLMPTQWFKYAFKRVCSLPVIDSPNCLIP